MDLGQTTVRDFLKKKLGDEAAERVLKEVNDAQLAGKQGEGLYRIFKDAVKKEGFDITVEESNIMYGFLVP